MSGRTLARLGVAVLIALAAFAGGLENTADASLMDFEWGAPASNAVVDLLAPESALTVR
ncbi:hypothetical protein [Micromonospora siamensis]|uniref:Uncharacterized protein n=1 Tax=Micromonospora siamensis TaxID=299152 RepID=A0A1C5K6N9_9ACTN|nr:hypothetical protein [Micromonospora siamensis]SCG78410.1 hypothetical protein GA0074704_5645 [Micromonospora siamensis]